jgi:hypothetical protein
MPLHAKLDRKRLQAQLSCGKARQLQVVDSLPSMQANISLFHDMQKTYLHLRPQDMAQPTSNRDPNSLRNWVCEPRVMTPCGEPEKKAPAPYKRSRSLSQATRHPVVWAGNEWGHTPRESLSPGGESDTTWC